MTNASRDIDNIRRSYNNLAVAFGAPVIGVGGMNESGPAPRCAVCGAYGFPVLYRVAPFWVFRCACGLRVSRLTRKWAAKAWARKCKVVLRRKEDKP